MTVANNKHNIDFTVGATTYGLLVKKAYDPIPIEPFIANIETGKGEFAALTNKKIWEMNDWSAGMGLDVWEDGSARYKDANGITGHVDGHLFLAPAVLATSATDLGAVPVDCLGFMPSPLAHSDYGRWTYSDGDGAGGASGSLTDGGSVTQLRFSASAQDLNHWARYQLGQTPAQEPWPYGDNTIAQMQYILTYVVGGGGVWQITIYGVKNATTTFSATTGLPAGVSGTDYEQLDQFSIPATGMGARTAPGGTGATGKVWTGIVIHAKCTTADANAATITFATVTMTSNYGDPNHFVLTPTKVYMSRPATTTYTQMYDYSVGVTTQLVTYKGWLLALGGNDTPIRLSKDPGVSTAMGAAASHWVFESNGVVGDYAAVLDGVLYLARSVSSGRVNPAIDTYSAIVDSGTWTLTAATAITGINEHINPFNGLATYRYFVIAGMRDGLWVLRPVKSYHWDYDTDTEVATTNYQFWRAFDHSGAASAYVGSSIITWRGRLFYNTNGDVCQYSGNFQEVEAESRAIGPSSTDRSGTLSGNVVKLLPTTNNLLAVLDGGTGAESRIMLYNGKGWHPFYVGASGARITTLWRDNRSSNLWFNAGQYMKYVYFPDSDHFSAWDDAVGTSGTLDFSRWDAGYPSLSKWLQKITVNVANITSSATCVFKYKLNGASSWTTLGTLNNTSTPTAGTTYTLSFPAGTTCHYLDLQIGLTNTPVVPAKPGPDVTHVGLHYRVNGPKYYGYPYRVYLENNQLLRDGTLETNSIATLKAALKSAYESTSPISFTDPAGTAHTVVLRKMQPIGETVGTNDTTNLATYAEYDLLFEEIPA